MDSSIADHCCFEQRMNNWMSSWFKLELVLIDQIDPNASGQSTGSSEHILFLFVMMDLHELLYLEGVISFGGDSWEIVLALKEGR